MKTISVLITILLTCLISCTKQGIDSEKCSGTCYILTGRIVDTPSNAGLKAVELKFYHRYSGFTLFDPTTYLGRTITDENGNYRFQFNGKNYKDHTGYFLMELKKSGYFYTSSGNDDIEKFYLDSTQFNIPFNQRIAMFRKATLTVSVKPTSGVKYEFLTFLYSHGNNASGVILNRNQIKDTTFSFQTAGDINTIIQWDAAGNTPRISQTDTLFTPQGGTIYYRIDL